MAKSWAWSYSKLKNYITCPKRHYEVDIQRNYTDSSEQLVWGNEVHAELAKAANDPTVRLPDSMAEYQRWVDEARAAKANGAHVLVEQKYAITKEFQPTSWFAHNAWYRGIADIVMVMGNSLALARDYKTGKVQHDSVQLMLMSQCLFAHIPTLQRIKTEFIWLKDDCKTEDTFLRKDMFQHWPAVLPKVAEMEKASNTLTYPPTPNRLCARYCPVTSCPFHGKRH